MFLTVWYYINILIFHGSAVTQIINICWLCVVKKKVLCFDVISSARDRSQLATIVRNRVSVFSESTITLGYFDYYSIYLYSRLPLCVKSTMLWLPRFWTGVSRMQVTVRCSAFGEGHWHVSYDTSRETFTVNTLRVSRISTISYKWAIFEVRGVLIL